MVQRENDDPRIQHPTSVNLTERRLAASGWTDDGHKDRQTTETETVRYTGSDVIDPGSAVRCRSRG